MKERVPTPEGMTLTPNKGAFNDFKATKPPLKKKRKSKKIVRNNIGGYSNEIS